MEKPVKTTLAFFFALLIVSSAVAEVFTPFAMHHVVNTDDVQQVAIYFAAHATDAGDLPAKYLIVRMPDDKYQIPGIRVATENFIGRFVSKVENLTPAKIADYTNAAPGSDVVIELKDDWAYHLTNNIGLTFLLPTGIITN